MFTLSTKLFGIHNLLKRNIILFSGEMYFNNERNLFQPVTSQEIIEIVEIIESRFFLE